MPDENQKDQDQSPSFKVRDRRSFNAEGEKRPEEANEAREDEAAKQAAPPPEGRKEKPRAPLPAIDFGTFVLSLSTSALVHLGEVADPKGEPIPQDLALAKQTIDILGMLKEKTRGNLTPEEDSLLENLLYDLRMRYVAKLR